MQVLINLKMDGIKKKKKKRIALFELFLFANLSLEGDGGGMKKKKKKKEEWYKKLKKKQGSF